MTSAALLSPLPPFHKRPESLLPPAASLLITTLSESTFLPHPFHSHDATNNIAHSTIVTKHEESSSSSSSSMTDASDDDDVWLKLVFKAFDENGDGKISKEEMANQFQKVLGMEMAGTDASLISLCLDEEEFIRVYQSTSQEDDEEEEMAQVFRVFDKNGDGLISSKELQSVLCSLGFPQGRNLSACQDMISRVDGDGNGHIDFLEFKRMMRMPLSA